MTVDPRIEGIVRHLAFKDVEWAVETSRPMPDYYHRYFHLEVPVNLRSPVDTDGIGSVYMIRADALLLYMLHIRLTS